MHHALAATPCMIPDQNNIYNIIHDLRVWCFVYRGGAYCLNVTVPIMHGLLSSELTDARNQSAYLATKQCMLLIDTYKAKYTHMMFASEVCTVYMW